MTWKKLVPRPRNHWQQQRELLHHRIHQDLEPVYGEIYVQANASAVTLNSAAKVQVTNFDTNGASSGATPDHTNDHITVVKAGTYQCMVSVAFANAAAQSHKVEVGVWVNNGATEYANVHTHRNFSAGVTDVGSASLSGLVVLAVDDTVELWADTGDAGDRDVVFEDVTLTIVRVSA